MLRLKASLTCDYATRDRNGKAILVGVFSNFQSKVFPLHSPRFFSYSVWEGEPSRHQLNVQILSPDKTEEVLDVNRTLDCPMDMTIGEGKKAAEITIQMGPVDFPSPGDYWLRYLVDGRAFGEDMVLPVLKAAST